MRSRSFATTCVAVASAFAFLTMMSNPALASTGTGVASSGDITIDSAQISPPITVDLANPAAPPTCTTPIPQGDPAEFDLDVTGTTSTITDARFDPSYSQVNGSTWYRLDMSLYEADPTNWPNTGTIDGAPSPYDVDQLISLTGTIRALSTPPACVVGSVVCEFFVTLSVSGTFTGSLAQPITGSTDLDGGMVLADYTTCNAPFASIFDSGTIDVADLVIDF